MSDRKSYRSEDIVVTFEPRLCIHSERCVHGAPSVFDPSARPWIQPGNASAETLAAVVRQCPTGALQFERLDGGAAEQPDASPSIHVVAGGPLHVRGDVTVQDAEGRIFRRTTRVALCRCGASANKPYCDGTHSRIGFTG